MKVLFQYRTSVIIILLVTTLNINSISGKAAKGARRGAAGQHQKILKKSGTPAAASFSGNQQIFTSQGSSSNIFNQPASHVGVTFKYPVPSNGQGQNQVQQHGAVSFPSRIIPGQGQGQQQRVSYPSNFPAQGQAQGQASTTYYQISAPPTGLAHNTGGQVQSASSINSVHNSGGSVVVIDPKEGGQGQGQSADEKHGDGEEDIMAPSVLLVEILGLVIAPLIFIPAFGFVLIYLWQYLSGRNRHGSQQYNYPTTGSEYLSLGPFGIGQLHKRKGEQRHQEALKKKTDELSSRVLPHI